MTEDVERDPPAYLPGPKPAPVAAGDLLRDRIVAVTEVILCSSVPTQIAIGLLLRLAGWSPTDAAGHLSLSFVVTLSLADMALLVVLMVVLLRAHGESAADLWLGRRPRGRETRLGFLLIPVVFVSVVVLLNVIRLVAPSLHNVADNPLEQLARTPLQAAIFGLVVIFAGGVREELQRAFLLRRFEQHLGGATAGLVVISVGFGLGHTVQGWDAVMATGALGAFWAVVYLRRRSSIAPMVSHAGFNALEVLGAAFFP